MAHCSCFLRAIPVVVARNKMTWAPMRPCCLANYYLGNRMCAPDRTVADANLHNPSVPSGRTNIWPLIHPLHYLCPCTRLVDLFHLILMPAQATLDRLKNLFYCVIIPTCPNALSLPTQFGPFHSCTASAGNRDSTIILAFACLFARLSASRQRVRHCSPVSTS